MHPTLETYDCKVVCHNYYELWPTAHAQYHVRNLYARGQKQPHNYYRAVMRWLSSVCLSVRL